jgi:hypothetical protein
MACGCIVTRRTMIHYLNQTSMGRAVTQATEEDVRSVWTTEEWVAHAGHIMLDVPAPQRKTPKNKRRSSSVSQRGGRRASGDGEGEAGHEMGPIRRRVGGQTYDAVPPVPSSYAGQGRWRAEDFR